VRVCLIVPGFSSSERDWCIPALLDLVTRLGETLDLWVLALRYPFEAGSYSVFSNPVRALGAADRKGGARVLLYGRAISAVLGQHRRRPFDLIHGLWADEAGLIASVCGGLIRRPVVVSVMGGELVWFEDLGYGLQGSRVGRFVVEGGLRWADEVTVGSATLEPLLTNLFRRLSVSRLPLGVDVDRFSPDGPTRDLEGSPALLNVASLTPVKDQRTLIDAFAQAQRGAPGAHLHVVGEGPQHDTLMKRAGEGNLTGAVTFHGAVPHHDLPQLYRAADLNVVSSRFESQGMTVLEAAACGTGTVGTEVGVLPEFGDGVRTVPVNDSSRLAGELSEFSLDRSLSAALGRSAHTAVHDRFTLDKCTEGFIHLYRRCIPSRS
jgi:glycosyltransferase involved in cell wall biosynthesis